MACGGSSCSMFGVRTRPRTKPVRMTLMYEFDGHDLSTESQGLKVPLTSVCANSIYATL